MRKKISYKEFNQVKIF